MRSLLSNYLTNDNQYSQCNGIGSKVNPIYCDVPQGSTLRPLFFSMYTNDLPLHNRLLVNLFAHNIVLISKNKTNSFYYTRVKFFDIALWPIENDLMTYYWAMAHRLETSELSQCMFLHICFACFVF